MDSRTITGHSTNAFWRMGTGPRTGTRMYLHFRRIIIQGMKREMLIAGLIIVIVPLIRLTIHCSSGTSQKKESPAKETEKEWPWEAPDISSVPENEEGELIRYGRQLIAQ